MNTRVNITGLAYGGKGVGRVGGRVVFVPFTAPGDEVDVEIVREKKRFSEGRVTTIIKPSEDRVPPLCPVFTLCGGCSLQHVRYSQQVLWKEKIFFETLKRIGGFEEFELEDTLPAPEPFFYRSKARFQVLGERWGFFEAGSKRVVDIESCPISEPLINSAFKSIRRLFEGRFRRSHTAKTIFSLEIGVGADALAAASFHLRGGEKGFPWGAVLEEVEELKGLEVLLHARGGPRARRVFTGGDLNLCYESQGIKYLAPLSVFSQVNRAQNGALIKDLIRYSRLKGGERVLELFSGAGNFSLQLAKGGARVLGVEVGGEAVRAARKNAALNAIEPVEFLKAPASKWLRDNLKDLETDSPDMVVLDPPRAGDISAMRGLAEIRPKKIIYLSCSPPTMARDLKVFAAGGYRITRARVFDLFPQTYHIEGMVVMELGD